MRKTRHTRIVQWLHKYCALLGLFFFTWMALSGIILNHPQLLKKYSLPNQIMPANYQYRNWNRMSWRDAVFSASHENILYVGGKEGVWKSLNQGKSFQPLTAGFPAATYERDTLSLLLAINQEQETLYAGTRSGLFYQSDESWQRVDHPILRDQAVVELLQIDNRILAFTDSAIYQADTTVKPPTFTPLALPRNLDKTPTVPLFRWLLKVHDGSIIGLPGRLLADFIGLTLFFLCLSGVIIWYVIQRKKRHRSTFLSGKLFAFNYRWHLKIGIFSALFITTIALSGALVRPPLLIAIIRLAVPASLMPDADSKNPWAGQIQKAAYLKGKKELIIASKQGLFRGPIDSTTPFTKIPAALPIHGMGAMVFEALDDYNLLIGSFSGLYIWDTKQQTIMQLKSKATRGNPNWGKSIMVTGAAVYQGRPLLVADYNDGLKPLRRRPQANPTMPDEIRSKSRIALWNALFELHNGRIFEQFIGLLYWLIIPLGGILLLITTLSGTINLLRRNHRKAPRQKGTP
ncbi:MAG: PepSY-associated TM helix domain-containing protein [Pseudomonadota bacterium]|nr:PepSY-associated TM helix domain-containing protein [Pseudomonadota bacterium]